MKLNFETNFLAWPRRCILSMSLKTVGQTRLSFCRMSVGDSVKHGCGRRMRTSDNYKIRKIRNDRSFSSFNLRTIACNLYPCELVLIQKWQVPKHLDLKGRLISGTLCKTNLGLRVLQRRPLATLLMPCYRPKFLVALHKSILVLG